MKTIQTMVLVTMLALLTACGGEPTLDASSEASLEQSMAKMTEGMSDEEKTEFGMSIVTFTMAKAMETGMDEEKLMQAFQELDGMTISEIQDYIASEYDA